MSQEDNSLQPTPNTVGNVTTCDVQTESQGHSVHIEVCSEDPRISVSNVMHCDQHKDKGLSVVDQVTSTVKIQCSCIPLDPFQANLPEDWRIFREGDEEILFIKIVVEPTRVITEKSLRLLGNSVNYFVRGEICTPSHLVC